MYGRYSHRPYLLLNNIKCNITIHFNAYFCKT